MGEIGFHVTHQSNIPDIRSNGLKPRDDGDWREKRKELRNIVDEYAQEHATNWVNRENAVFFWTTIDDAMKFINTHFENWNDFVIISVDLNGKKVWQAESEFMEEMYRDWMDDRNLEYDLQQLQNHSQIWTGEQEPDYEIWCQPPIGPERIQTIN